jgi:hypothetical protein
MASYLIKLIFISILNMKSIRISIIYINNETASIDTATNETASIVYSRFKSFKALVVVFYHI